MINGIISVGAGLVVGGAVFVGVVIVNTAKRIKNYFTF